MGAQLKEAKIRKLEAKGKKPMSNNYKSPSIIPPQSSTAEEEINHLVHILNRTDLKPDANGKLVIEHSRSPSDPMKMTTKLWRFERC